MRFDAIHERADIGATAATLVSNNALKYIDAPSARRPLSLPDVITKQVIPDLRATARQVARMRGVV